MRAAVYERTGPAHEVLSIRDVPRPNAGHGEVRVKLRCSGVNPSDVKSRAGSRSKSLPFPVIIPHSDGAGVIDQAGDDVPRSRIGERVWTWNAAWRRANGTAAEFVVLPAEQAVPIPEGTDFSAGACLGIPALTAYHATALGGGVKDKVVFIAGGAGAVGHYAIQFAKLSGAKQVIATVSGSEKATLARTAGADIILNYKTDDVAQSVRDLTDGTGVDRIIEVDFATNVKLDLAIIRPEGEVVVYGSSGADIAMPFLPAILKNILLRFFIVYNLSPSDRRRAIDNLTALLAANRLLHNVAAHRSLDQIAEAHELVEQGVLAGNVVIDI